MKPQQRIASRSTDALPELAVRPSAWSAATLAILLASGLTGCESGAGPIVSGPGYLGIGWFVDRRPEKLLSESQGVLAPLCIDVEGVGLLMVPGRLNVGYIQANYIAISPDDHVHIRLSRLEAFAGRAADQAAAKGLQPRQH